MQYDVRLDIKEVEKRLGFQFKQEIAAAVPSALNRVAVSARVTAVNDITRRNRAEEVHLSASVLPIYRATRAQPEAKIVAKKYAPNLINFSAREVKAGVSANAWRNRKIYKGAFIGNQGRTVFSRTDYRPATGQRRTLRQHTRRAHQRSGYTRGNVAVPSHAVRAHSVGNGAKKPRAKIKALYGPSVPKTFLQDAVQRSISANNQNAVAHRVRAPSGVQNVEVVT
jgi:hypothetical protein